MRTTGGTQKRWSKFIPCIASGFPRTGGSELFSLRTGSGTSTGRKSSSTGGWGPER